jgi:serine/threonine protein phosphatase 1
MRRHPAAQYLFQSRNGRLDEAALGRQCPTPRRTIQVADALGVATPGLPEAE